MGKWTTKLGVLAVAGAMSGSAAASYAVDCESLAEEGVMYVAMGISFQQLLSAVAGEPGYSSCLDGKVLLADANVRATSFQFANAMSSVVGNRLLGNAGPQKLALAGMEGMAAGGSGAKWNTWANVSSNDSDYDWSANGLTVANSAKTRNYAVGGDYAFAPGMVAGVSAAFDRSHGKADAAGNRLRGDGYLAAAYVGMQINENLALDVSIGTGDGDRKTGTQSRTDVDRNFYAGNLTYTRWVGALQYSGKASWLHGKEDVSDIRFAGVRLPGTGGTTKVSQGRISAEVGYWMDGLMPYAGAGYVRDTSRTNTLEPWDKSAIVWTAGVNFFSIRNKVTGGIGYQSETNRRHTDNDTWVANVSIAF